MTLAIYLATASFTAAFIGDRGGHRGWPIGNTLLCAFSAWGWLTLLWMGVRQ